MSSFQSKFHIEPDAGPSEIYEYLDTLIAERPTSNEEMLDAASRLGHDIGTYERIRVGPTLARFGVVEPDDSFTLTELGDQFVDVMYQDRSLFHNVLHFLYYTAYDRYPSRHIYTSYSYKAFTEYIYDNGPFDSFYGSKSTIVGEVSTRAQRDDALDLDRTSAGVSLSTKSFDGLLNFIRELEPSVNPNPPGDTPGFEPRSFCPPGLVLLGVDFLYQQTETEYETLLRIEDDDRQLQLRRLLLITDNGFEEALEYADQSYPFFDVKQDWGRNVRLDREITLADLL